MICKECGHLLKEGDKFCPNCGSKVELAVPTPGASTSRLDDLMFNLDRKTENRTSGGSAEAPAQPKKDFKFDEINWNLDGYPSEEKEKTEEIDFNWEAVVEDGKNSAGAVTRAENTGMNATQDAAAGTPNTAEDIAGRNAAQDLGQKNGSGFADAESADKAIDRFYTPNKKNEEFQAILDREYDRLTEKSAGDQANADVQTGHDGSYLGNVNEDLLDRSREDRDAFRAMEEDKPGFEECVADKLETPDDRVKVPEIVKGQNYSVVGEPSEQGMPADPGAGDEQASAVKNEDPEQDVERYIENLNADEVSLVDLLKAAAKKEQAAEATPTEPLPQESYLGKVDEELLNPGKDDRNAFRKMEKDAPGFEECVADKLETPDEGPQIPDFMSGQNYSVVGEPDDIKEETHEQAEETHEQAQEDSPSQDAPSTLDDLMNNSAGRPAQPQKQPVEEPIEVVGFAPPHQNAGTAVFASEPSQSGNVDMHQDVAQDMMQEPAENAQQADNNPFAAFEKPVEPASEPDAKNENAQIIENMIKEDAGTSQMSPADNKITFRDVFKDEIKSETEEPKEETKPKKHTFLKILVVILAVLIVLELIIIIIKGAFPNSAAASAFQNIFNAVLGKFT